MRLLIKGTVHRGGTSASIDRPTDCGIEQSTHGGTSIDAATDNVDHSGATTRNRPFALTCYRDVGNARPLAPQPQRAWPASPRLTRVVAAQLD